MERKEELKRKRSENWTEEDKTLLKELVKQRVKYIENKNTDTDTNQSKKKAWMEVEESFNNLCTGGKRTLIQLKNQWVAIKVLHRKQVADHRKDVAKAGGGSKPPEIPMSSDDISVWLPNEFVVDYNEFDSNSTFKKVEQEDAKSDSFKYEEEVPSDSEENFSYVETKEMPKVKKCAEKRVRSQNFTVYEEDILVSLVERFQDIVESKQTDRYTCRQKKTTWQIIEQEFCALADTYRTTKMLKEKYDQLKVKTRQLMSSQNHKVHSATEDTYCRNTQLRSSITNRMAAILTKSGTLKKYNNCNYFEENTSEERSNGNYSETEIKYEIEETKLEDNVTTNNIQYDELHITADDELHITADKEENKNSLPWHPLNTISSKSTPLDNNISDPAAEVKLSNNLQSDELINTTPEEKNKNSLPWHSSNTISSKSPPLNNNISELTAEVELSNNSKSDKLINTTAEEKNKNSLSWHPSNTISSKSPPLNNNISELTAEVKLSNNSKSDKLIITTEEEKKINSLPRHISHTKSTRSASLSNNISMLADKAKLIFFQNEEIRAAERHLWEKELHDKRLMCELEIKKKKLELLNIQIENARNRFNSEYNGS